MLLGAIGRRTKGGYSEMGQVREAASPARDFDSSEDDNPPLVSRQIAERTRFVPAVRCRNKRVTIFVWAVLAVFIYSDGECGHRM
jgi:hypothetical protein